MKRRQTHIQGRPKPPLTSAAEAASGRFGPPAP